MIQCFPITLASDGKALKGLWFDGQKYFADTLDKDHFEKELPVFQETRRWQFTGEYKHRAEKQTNRYEPFIFKI